MQMTKKKIIKEYDHAYFGFGVKLTQKGKEIAELKENLQCTYSTIDLYKESAGDVESYKINPTAEMLAVLNCGGTLTISLPKSLMDQAE